MMTDKLLPKLGAVIERTFRFMDVAEEEIQRAYPKRRGEPENVFRACCPPPILRSFGDKLYRAHVREILRRLKTDADIRPATDAELLGVLSKTSLDAPLTREGMAVYTFLFDKLFPEHGIAISQPEYPGQVEEKLAETRRRFRVEDRGKID